MEYFAAAVAVEVGTVHLLEQTVEQVRHLLAVQEPQVAQRQVAVEQGILQQVAMLQEELAVMVAQAVAVVAVETSTPQRQVALAVRVAF